MISGTARTLVASLALALRDVLDNAFSVRTGGIASCVATTVFGI
jgi:hypothetical protein